MCVCVCVHVCVHVCLCVCVCVLVLHTGIHAGLTEADVSMDGEPGQRPFPKGNLADPEISLRDDVMLDDPEAEEKLDKIGHKWELAHSEIIDLLASFPGLTSQDFIVWSMKSLGTRLLLSHSNHPQPHTKSA